MSARLALLLALFVGISSHALAQPASTFDGTWTREWTKTTPRGVHVVGRRLIAIRSSGVSTERSELTLTQTISGVTKTLHILQTCEATHTELKGSVLAIRWSAPKLISPKLSDIPPGFRLWTTPVTSTYTLRGQDLLATIEGETDVFHRSPKKT